MWSSIEIIQFVTINLLSIFFMYFSIINFLDKESNKKRKNSYLSLFIFNLLWFILIYILTFILWKTSWGVNQGINLGFIITDVIVLILACFLDKRFRFKVTINKKED
ncbi:hypothetical protein [Spiroplasma endosymbiont of Diplazon laetatorius]|uniref:hypothetical protein n=1 Tax=Spiroplasma endosymbiont of Diplazon laetatorius TaxID=3066322 RepID=UPI0030CF5498